MCIRSAAEFQERSNWCQTYRPINSKSEVSSALEGICTVLFCLFTEKFIYNFLSKTTFVREDHVLSLPLSVNCQAIVSSLLRIIYTPDITVRYLFKQKLCFLSLVNISKGDISVYKQYIHVYVKQDVHGRMDNKHLNSFQWNAISLWYQNNRQFFQQHWRWKSAANCLLQNSPQRCNYIQVWRLCQPPEDVRYLIPTGQFLQQCERTHMQ